MTKLLNIVVACAENRVIGRAGRLPWRIPEDFENFQRLTAGGVCVLGRVCFDTWSGATREGRQPVVLTHHPLPQPEPPPTETGRDEARRAGRSVPVSTRTLDEALAVAETIPGDIFICGGQQVFEETLRLDRPTRLYLTVVHAEIPGDRFFPDWRQWRWLEVNRRDSRNERYAYTFHTLEKVR